MDMKKNHLCLIVMIISLIFLLSGCIKIDIKIGVDEGYTAFLSYDIEMDLEKIDIRYKERIQNALNRIGWHYQEENGFIVELDIENNPSRLVMTKRTENDSFENAYKSLESMLTNENITPFMTVDMASDNSKQQNRYIFKASTDISQIIQLSNAEELSPVLQEEFINAIETGEGTITLLLPASEIISFSHQVNILYHQAIMAVPLSYTDKTELELTGVVNINADGSPGGSIHEITHELTKYRNLTVIGTCAVLVLLLIVVLLRMISKNKR